MPLTFLLSKEYVNFVEEFHKMKDTDDYNIWIVKPVGKSRGKGIFLIDNISDVPLNDTFLVQKYLTSPLLLDEGYKFDMRIYSLVTSVNPLEMFLYKDGFARVSNELYSMDISNMKVHLTNAAIQNRQAKKSKNFEKIYGGSKISLDMLRDKLRRQYGIDFDSVIWNNNTAIIQLSDILLYFLDELRQLHYKFTLNLLFSFTTPYSSLLYRWLQPLSTENRADATINVEHLRKLLHCDNRYLIFRDFRKFVLEKATAEINQMTELTVNYTFEKIVTKVIKIKFSVILTPKTA